MKKLLLILALCCFVDSAEWRQTPVVLQTTVEHQMLPEYDTIIARHYHTVENKIYIITVDSTELWVDNIKVLNGGIK
jgi:hypothetical protein